MLPDPDQRRPRTAATHVEQLTVRPHEIAGDQIVLEVVRRGASSTFTTTAAARGSVLRERRYRDQRDSAENGDCDPLLHTGLHHGFGRWVSTPTGYDNCARILSRRIQGGQSAPQPFGHLGEPEPLTPPWVGGSGPRARLPIGRRSGGRRGGRGRILRFLLRPLALL